MICSDMSDAAPSFPAIEALDQTRRQLAALDDLTGHGLAVSKAIAEQASCERAEPVVADIALAYARVSRAVRQAVQLQQQLIKDLPAAWPRGEQDEDDEHSGPEEDRKERVVRIVERVARDRHPADDEALENLMIDAVDRLDDDDLYGDLMERPLSELVARLCKDVGLEPDWPGLSQELWARRESQSGDVGAPLAAADGRASSPVSGSERGRWPEGTEGAFRLHAAGHDPPQPSP